MNNELTNSISRFSMDPRLKAFREKRKTEDYLMLTITLVALIFFGAFIIRPSILLILELNQRSKEYADLSKRLDAKIKILEQIKSEEGSRKDNVALLNIAITEKANESDILNNINFVASKNNVQLGNIQFQFDKLNPIVKISFKATGTYENTIAMFSDINNLLTPVNINSVEIKPDKEYGDNILELGINAESYFSNQ